MGLDTTNLQTLGPDTINLRTMHEDVVGTLFETNLRDAMWEVSDAFYVYTDSEDPHTLKIDLQDENNVLIAAGTKIMRWELKQEFNEDFIQVDLYLHENSYDDGEAVACKLSNSDLLAHLKAYLKRR